ncbi:MAG: DEAD/DEAH box helicase [Eubacteriales bacterium]
MKNLNFNELMLSDGTKKALNFMGFEEATPIQSKAIPIAMRGLDVIGQAQTGTGKTCAFGIPAVELIDPKQSGVQVLVLCPTRELAIQVADEIRNLCKFHKGIKTLAIYGGQPIERQITALKNKPQIIIGTPGRVMDHMRRHTLKLQNLKIAVLDEADEMLNMGFRDDIDSIFEEISSDRQTMLFSATMPKGILEIADSYMKNPEHVVTLQKEITIDTIEQFYIEVREKSKLELLCRLVDVRNIKLGIVFCNMKWKVDELCSSLQARGYSAEALHGDMKQRERDRVMSKFRNGQVELLVATDVAARGIDVDGIEAVFNYDIPNDEEYYVHRIGRTGRAGKKGISYSFAFGKDLYKLRDIERYTKSKIIRTKPPTIVSIEITKQEAAIKEVVETILKGGFAKYTDVIEQILDELPEFTTLDVAAALFKMKFSELDSKNYEESELDDDYTFKRKNKFERMFKQKGGNQRSRGRTSQKTAKREYGKTSAKKSGKKRK